MKYIFIVLGLLVLSCEKTILNDFNIIENKKLNILADSLYLIETEIITSKRAALYYNSSNRTIDRSFIPDTSVNEMFHIFIIRDTLRMGERVYLHITNLDYDHKINLKILMKKGNGRWSIVSKKTTTGHSLIESFIIGLK